MDKSEVRRGDNIAIFGQSAPDAEITITVNSEEEFFVKTLADDGGVYLYNFDTSVLKIDQHFTKSKAAVDGEIKGENDNPTIGLLICKSKNDTVVEYSFKDINKPLGISEYQLTKVLPDGFKSSLPTIEEIEAELGIGEE